MGWTMTATVLSMRMMNLLASTPTPWRLGSEGLGDELWAYIPQTLLPHLKFLAAPEYAHSYYVDLKPKIFDAQIIADGTHWQ
jgi:Tfp pilus tip-associated adhesin PilY1